MTCKYIKDTENRQKEAPVTNTMNGSICNLHIRQWWSWRRATMIEIVQKKIVKKLLTTNHNVIP